MVVLSFLTFSGHRLPARRWFTPQRYPIIYNNNNKNGLAHGAWRHAHQKLLIFYISLANARAHRRLDIIRVDYIAQVRADKQAQGATNHPEKPIACADYMASYKSVCSLHIAYCFCEGFMHSREEEEKKITNRRKRNSFQPFLFVCLINNNKNGQRIADHRTDLTLILFVCLALFCLLYFFFMNCEIVWAAHAAFLFVCRSIRF